MALYSRKSFITMFTGAHHQAVKLPTTTSKDLQSHVSEDPDTKLSWNLNYPD
jgi:hypothetical protein